MGDYASFNLCRVMVVFPYFILLLLYAVFRADSVGLFVAANLVGLSFATLVAIIRSLRLLPTHRFAARRSKEIIRFGFVSHLGTLASSETLRLDLVVVALILNANSLGMYTIASSVMFLPRLVGQSIGIVALTEQSASSVTGRKSVAARRFRQCVLLTVPTVMGLCIASPFIIQLAFGSEFAGATKAAVLLAIGGGVVSVRRVLADSLRGIGDQRFSTISEVISLLLSMLLIVPLIRWWGLEGAAAAFLVSHLTSLIIIMPVSITRLNIPPSALIPNRGDLEQVAQKILAIRNQTFHAVNDGLK